MSCPHGAMNWSAVCDCGISLSLFGFKVICKTGASERISVFPDIILNSFVNNEVLVCALSKP